MSSIDLLMKDFHLSLKAERDLQTSGPQPRLPDLYRTVGHLVPDHTKKQTTYITLFSFYPQRNIVFR